MLIDTTLLSLKEQAENGDLEAQMDMGVAYEMGDGVPLDYATAIKYYLLCLEHGVDKLAEHGYSYETLMWGIGRFYDLLGQHLTAFKWYRETIQFIHDTYLPQFTEQLIEYHNLRECLKKVSTFPESGMWLYGQKLAGYTDIQ